MVLHQHVYSTTQGKSDLKEHLKRFSGKPYEERLADVHLLLWLSKQPNLDPSDMMAVCQAVKDKTPLLEGYKVIIDSIAGL